MTSFRISRTRLRCATNVTLSTSILSFFHLSGSSARRIYSPKVRSAGVSICLPSSHGAFAAFSSGCLNFPCNNLLTPFSISPTRRKGSANRRNWPLWSLINTASQHSKPRTRPILTPDLSPRFPVSCLAQVRLGLGREDSQITILTIVLNRISCLA